MEERYFVEASDGQRYGPADLATLKEWVAMGRLVPTSTLVGETSGERRTAGEIAELFGTPGDLPPVVGASPQGVPPTGYAAPVAPPRKNRTALWVGIGLFGVLCLCGAPIAAIILPVLAPPRWASTRTSGLSNMKMLGTAMRIYSADHDDTFPPRMETALALRPTLSRSLPQNWGDKGSIFRTVNPNGGEILGNARLGGTSETSLANPYDIPLFYDRLAWPGGRGPVAYADGSARVIDHATTLDQISRAPFGAPRSKGTSSLAP